MHKYFLIFNNITNLDIDILISKRPSKPSPIKRYEEVQVPGSDGVLYKDKGYGDIDITVSFNFASKKADEWDMQYRKVKKWLLNKIDNKLIFSDDLEVFYKVNKVVINTPERVLKRIGRFEVTFTCDPYTYLKEGLIELDLVTNIYNSNELSLPIYNISGEGLLALNVNGNLVKVNVGQHLTINTELGLCFREDGSINNVALNGKYTDLMLKEENNNFSWSNGFNIKIIPNWRCL